MEDKLEVRGWVSLNFSIHPPPINFMLFDFHSGEPETQACRNKGASGRE